MECAMCTEACNESTAISANIVLRTKFFVVGINPRWSPHFGRVFIAPLRHIGADGVYGFEALTPEEHEEYNILRKRVTDALIKGFKKYGMKQRDGCAHIDYIIRPSVHPSADLFPAYEHPPAFSGYTWPAYLPTEFMQGSAPEEIQGAPPILSSLSKPALIMPEELRRKLSEYIAAELVA